MKRRTSTSALLTALILVSGACSRGQEQGISNVTTVTTAVADATTDSSPSATSTTTVGAPSTSESTTALAVTSSRSVVATTPAPAAVSPTTAPVTSPATTRPPAAPIGVWHPAANSSWQWMISHALDISSAKDMGLVDPSGNTLPNAAPTVYDIDWEYNGSSTVAQLHARGKRVICYVDVGVYESYRPDAASFPAGVRGNKDSHWQGSFWLDIRQRDVLLPIMKARLQTCKNKGFDAVEPDEIDGYSNSSGFPLTYADQLAYNRAIADLAHSMGLSIGLKGDIDQAKDLWTSFDWTLNEQCFEFSECSALSTYFVAHGKTVFEVEYDDPFSGHHADPTTFCPQANAANFNSMKMPVDLDGGRWPCR
jgi:hypothetical protein